MISRKVGFRLAQEDFHARLQRIGAGAEPPAAGPGVYARPAPPEPRKPNIGMVGAGGGLVGLGTHLLRKANRNYEVLRDAGELGVLSGFAIGGVVATLLGVWLIYRAFRHRGDAAREEGREVRQPSNFARAAWSILGLAFGATACSYMFMASAARLIDTDAAETFSAGGVLIAFALAGVSLLLGIVGLLRRGSSMVRVPIYFLFGGIITYAVFQYFWINPLEWPQFVAQLR